MHIVFGAGAVSYNRETAENSWGWKKDREKDTVAEHKRVYILEQRRAEEQAEKEQKRELDIAKEQLSEASTKMGAASRHSNQQSVKVWWSSKSEMTNCRKQLINWMWFNLINKVCLNGLTHVVVMKINPKKNWSFEWHHDL